MPSDDPESYLAILKASYAYEPQSDDEIAIKEDQLLLLVEKVDDEWWKVKIKSTSQETDSPVGLVPAAYVEQAEHTSVVRALYDYDATAPGELSLHEDDMLLVFDTEDDWLLVQSSKEEGKAGYVPGNYVEVVDENESPAAEPSRIIVPDDPPRPVSTYVDPADRVASSKSPTSAKVTGDDIQTWSVSEIDKKGKKKKGTLGIGNGAVFFASEADKTPVQKWQTKDVSAVSSEKSKHVRIDIGGSTPTSLHFHAGSKDNADSIMSKLQSSKALSSPPPEDEGTMHHPSASEMKKPSVHFSQTSPVIIPPEPHHEEEEEEEEEGEVEEVEEEQVQPHHPVEEPLPILKPGEEMAVALYDFGADGEDELSVSEGERLAVLEKDGDEWWKCRNAKGTEGVVPASYLEAIANSAIAAAPPRKTPVVDHQAEERKAKELQKQQQESERLRKEKEAEQERLAAAAQAKAEAQQKARQAALAAEAERLKRKEAAAARVSPPPAVTSPSRSLQEPRTAPSVNSRTSSEVTRPPPDKTRVWHDRSGQFRVEAAFLGFNKGKLRLHKVNGVIVEVPSEKMSLEDMQYVERYLDQKSRPPNGPRISEDDIPLALSPHAPKGRTSQNGSISAPPPKKGPKIDWFDFFLQAGCDLDDCTRYAASFDRDKIDETLLSDITESTMRSLGLREGDIIRVKKHIEKRKPTDNMNKPSAHLQEQLRRDEELARQLQAQESAPRGTAPNLFAGPGGVLKPRRGRPTPTKSLPLSTVDLKGISSASDQIQRTTSPQQIKDGPARNQTPTLPQRPDSASLPASSGFDDDAWTNRPSSTKPIKSMSPAPVVAPRAPSAPPPPQQQPAPTPTVAPTPPAPAPTQTPSAPSGPPSLAKTTESDIFEQLAKLSQLRQNSTPSHPQQVPQQPQRQPIQLTPSPALNLAPSGFSSGLGMGSSTVPMGQHFLNHPALSSPPQQPYNGPRGPFAPVPGNQSLLQPLIPVPTQQTGFNTFIPTKPPVHTPSPFGSQLSPPSFLSSQPTGFPSQQPMMSQPTGFNPQPIMSQPTGFNPQPMMSQPTGFNNFNSMQTSPFASSNGSAFRPLQNQMTGFNPPLNQSMFGPGPASPPPLPSNPTNNNSPANVFASMKSGTFANDDNTSNSGPNGQAPGWGQSYQGYTGY